MIKQIYICDICQYSTLDESEWRLHEKEGKCNE